MRRETIDRITQVADEIGYRPSPVARGLQNSKLGIIGLVIRPLHSLDTFLPPGVDYFSRMAGAAAMTALEHGYSMMLVADPTLPDAPFSALAADAYIVTDPFENDPVLTLLSEQHIPFVSVGSDPARPNEFVALSTRDEEEALLMLEHLEQTGASRIALVTGTDRNDWNIISERTYRAWCAERGIEPLLAAFSEADGEAVGEAVLDHFLSHDSPAQRPDAIFCLTGRHAAGVTSAALRRGIRVPHDLLIAAGSGAEQNRLSTPSVTSIDLNPEGSARIAVEFAVALAEGKPLPDHREVPAATLTVRESTSLEG